MNSHLKEPGDQIAQGDVWIKWRHTTPPQNVRTVTGPLVIAEGEKEGHMHLLVADDPIEVMLDETLNNGMKHVVARVGPSGGVLTHPEHGEVALPGNAVIDFRAGQQEYDPVQGMVRSID